MQEVEAKLLAILATTQNECLKELGLSPTLLHENRELQKQNAVLQQQYLQLQEQCIKLRDSNTKLYADNRSLALFIQQQGQHQQEQRMKLSHDPADQQKPTNSDSHEKVRLLTAERDELSRRLHAAYVISNFTVHRELL